MEDLSEALSAIGDTAALMVAGSESSDGTKVRFGQVTAVTRAVSGTKVSISISGSTITNIPCISTYTPVVNDNCAILQMNKGRWLAIGATNVGSAWTNYTHTMTGSTTNPTFTNAANSCRGHYMRKGDLGYFHIAFQWQGGDNVGSGFYLFGLPPAWDVLAAASFFVGSGWVSGGGTDRGAAAWRIVSYGGTNCQIAVYVGGTILASGTYAWSSAGPDRIEFGGVVPLA